MAASRQRIKAKDLYKSIGMILDGYTAEMTRDVDRAADKSSRELVDSLKRDSPRRTGEYAKSWSREKEGSVYIVRNKKHWRLTHLLEDGHRKRGNKGFVRAYPHIYKNADQAIQKFESDVEKIVKG